MSSARTSFETINTMDAAKSSLSTSTTSLASRNSAVSKSRMRKTWEAIKKHAKEHHQSVNAAYTVYYGQGQMGSQYSRQ